MQRDREYELDLAERRTRPQMAPALASASEPAVVHRNRKFASSLLERTGFDAGDKRSLTVGILSSRFELGMGVLRCSARRDGDRSHARRRVGNRQGLIVSALTFRVATMRAHCSRMWVPSTRLLWCYAIILATAHDFPPPPRDAAKPAASVSDKPCYTRRSKAF